jgi:hypothetical protein
MERLLSFSRHSAAGGVRTPSGLLVLHWNQRIGGTMGLWPLSDRSTARLTKARIKEPALTGRMMRPFRKAPAGRSNPGVTRHEDFQFSDPIHGTK